jgi:hypothetical protein
LLKKQKLEVEQMKVVERLQMEEVVEQLQMEVLELKYTHQITNHSFLFNHTSSTRYLSLLLLLWW